MRYFTEIQIPESDIKIDYHSKIIMLGSCFTENIGEKLERLKFSIDLNPFGILYNPVSVASSLEILLARRLMAADDLFFSEGVWQSFYHHGRFASPDKDQTLELMNSRILAGHKNLLSADFLFLTLGTAWAYEYIKTGMVVSNCHKVPASQFRRHRLSEPEITSSFLNLLKKLRETNPKLKVIFTVSPVRHWKDGAVENQVSKATLIVAISRILEEVGDAVAGYFPSYEIMMDELRDYRFYADDKIHLSDVAISHIWERFSGAFITTEARTTMKEVQKILDAAGHRPLNPGTPEFAGFAANYLNKVNGLMLKYPAIDFKPEKEYFERLLPMKNKLDQ